MRLVATVIAVVVLGAASAIAAGPSALFIGNSFTYGWGSGSIAPTRSLTLTAKALAACPRSSKSLLSKLAWTTTY